MAIRRRRNLAQLHISRTRGQAAVGERAARVVCGQRGRSMTVILAISNQFGVAYYEVGRPHGRGPGPRLRNFDWWATWAATWTDPGGYGYVLLHREGC